MAAQRSDVVVVGGGVIGCAVAWFLAREGVGVTLLEGDEIAGQASGAAAGMLAPFGEADAPGPLLRWGLRSLALFPALVAELQERSGVDPELEVSGILRVARGEAEAARLRRKQEALPDSGLAWLAGAELAALVPALTPAARGALYSPREGHVRSPLLVRAYAQAAAASGARIVTGTPVVGLRRERGRVLGVETTRGRHDAGQVVLCTGSWTRACASWVEPGLELPITPVRGQIVSLEPAGPPPGPIVWDEAVYLVPKRDGSLVAGATEERVGFDRRVTAAGVRGLLDAAIALLPALAAATFRCAWAGLRPETPDHLPLVGPLPLLDGLVLAAGHHRNGVLLSPVTGELVRDGVLGKGWREPAFLPERALPDLRARAF